MNCKKAMQELISNLTGSDTTLRSTDLDAHLSSCKHCREELMTIQTLWDGLDHLDVAAMSTEAAQRTLERLRSISRMEQATILVAHDSPRVSKYRGVVLAAVFVVALLTGAFVSRSSAALALFPIPATETDTVSIPSGSGGGLFLFLLHKPDGPRPAGQGVRYAQWADELRNVNQLVHAGALHETDGWMLARDGTTIGATPLGGPAGQVEGFFLIAAPDSAAVINAARISPHFDYGGLIEVRRITN